MFLCLTNQWTSLSLVVAMRMELVVDCIVPSVKLDGAGVFRRRLFFRSSTRPLSSSERNS